MKTASLLKRTLKGLAILALMVFVQTAVIQLLNSPRSSAAYEPGRIVDDNVFLDANSMNASQIQSFLVSKNAGLANMSFVVDCDQAGQTAKQAYLSIGAPCGQSKPASQIIYYASQVYGISPKVILVTMQKEQSLTTATNPTSWQLERAMGYGCPTSGGCQGASTFFYQIDNGSWVLRFHYERARGNMNWWYTSNSWTCGTEKAYYRPNLYPGQYVNFYDTNGTHYTTIFITNAATSSMYCYTPHAYNNPQGLYGRAPYGNTGLYYSGSYNFVLFFELWFGSTNGTEPFLRDSLPGGEIEPDTTLRGGDYISSPDGRFVTLMQNDGNLVTYRGKKAVWYTNTINNYGAYAKFQTDGNLVVYRANGSAAWNSGTHGSGANKVTLKNDGNLYINADSTQIYATNFKVSPSATNNRSSQISSGAKLNPGDYLKTSIGRYLLAMQTDGNLVLYATDGSALWSARTNGNPGAYASMQTDGNLVVYSAAGKALWWSGTAGRGNSSLSLQDDGNLVIYKGGGIPTWHTKTHLNNYRMVLRPGNQIAGGSRLNSTEYIISNDWRYRLLMQADGNLVLYSVNGYRALWNTRTNGNPGAYASMQTDGNLVVYSAAGKALWWSGTAGRGNSSLSLQDDGNLVIYKGGGIPTWGSGTNGKF